MKYSVKATRCNCHPETCCCDPWSIINNHTGAVICRVYHSQTADELCDALNKAEM